MHIYVYIYMYIYIGVCPPVHPSPPNLLTSFHAFYFHVVYTQTHVTLQSTHHFVCKSLCFWYCFSLFCFVFVLVLAIEQNFHVFGIHSNTERWGAGVETQKNVRGEIGGWGRVPFNETYAPSLSTIYDWA